MRSSERRVHPRGRAPVEPAPKRALPRSAGRGPRGAGDRPSPPRGSGVVLDGPRALAFDVGLRRKRGGWLQRTWMRMDLRHDG